MQLTELYSQVQTRILRLQEEVFSSPPKDMAAFEFRRGQWDELNQQLKELEKIIKGVEDDDKP